MHLARLGFLALLLFAVASGCGPKNRAAPASVRGEVRCKGELVPGGNITFHSAEKGSYGSSIGRDGSYSVVDLPDGEMTVTVETESVNPDKKTRSPGKAADKMHEERLAAEAKSGMGAGKAPRDVYRAVPLKYNSPKSSDLKVTLVPGKQTLNFDLSY
jgi:hypothetical protein